MKKDLRIKRESYIYENHIKLCYVIERKGTRQDFSSLSRDVFASLNKEEIIEVFKEKIGNTCKLEEYWTGIEIEVSCEKDKEEIKKAHKKVMTLLREIFEELERKEKEKNLSNWLWKEKIFRI